MEDAEVDEILRSVNPAVGGIVAGAYRKDRLKQLDGCVLRYILQVFLSQTQTETRAGDDSLVISTIVTLLFGFRVFETEDEATAVTKKVLELMDTQKLLAKAAAERRLANPVSIGKIYSESIRHAAINAVGEGVAVNWNDELNWDDKKERAKMERRKKKEEEKRMLLKEEYEDYMRTRGIALDSACVCMHRKAEGKEHGDDIRCDNIHVNMGKNVLLDNTQLYILSGKKYGLVGRNGSGKTTLMRMLTEREFEGVNPYIQILHVEQEVMGTTDTPLKIVLDTDVERTQLLRQEAEIMAAADPDMAVLNKVYERMDEIDAHTAEHRAMAILRGLSFTPDMMTRPSSSFSGGWRMRISLARALFIHPDVLLLDEPTNHLDLHAVLWLERFLQSWDRTLLVVSHSRSFLNNTCEEIIHLENQKLSYYKGDYDTFEKTRMEVMQQHQRSHEAQEKSKAHMQAFIDRFRYSAARAAQAQSRLKALERMDTLGPLLQEAQLNFSFPDPESSISPILQIVDVTFSYKIGSAPIFTDVNMGIDCDTRMGIVGANGSGKSTFLKVITGQLEAQGGQVIRNGKARIGMFSQHHVEVLNLSQTPLETMQSLFKGTDASILRSQLSRFGLSGDKQLQPNYTLSGGQKSRLAFAVMTFSKPDLLLMDEPTNHLDIDTVDALIGSLNAYKGGIIIVSHDEHLISSVCDELWVAGGSKLVKFDGDFNKYKKQVQHTL